MPIGMGSPDAAVPAAAVGWAAPDAVGCAAGALVAAAAGALVDPAAGAWAWPQAASSTASATAVVHKRVTVLLTSYLLEHLMGRSARFWLGCAIIA